MVLFSSKLSASVFQKIGPAVEDPGALDVDEDLAMDGLGDDALGTVRAEFGRAEDLFLDSAGSSPAPASRAVSRVKKPVVKEEPGISTRLSTRRVRVFLFYEIGVGAKWL